MVICYALWTLMLGRLSATTAAISTLTAPIVGVGSSMFILGDHVTWQKTTSLLMIVTSIVLTLLPRADRQSSVASR